METFSLVILLFISIILLLISSMIGYFVYKAFTNNIKKELKKELKSYITSQVNKKFEGWEYVPNETGDLYTKEQRIPLDQFVPRSDLPVNINMSKDNISKL